LGRTRRHRVRAERDGEPAKIVKNRRPSPIVIAQHLRGAVRDWREAFYAGASDTTRQLLSHSFERPHSPLRLGSGFGVEGGNSIPARDHQGPHRGRTRGAIGFLRHTQGHQGPGLQTCVCDTPLGEAVDAGIVKTPIIGKASKDLSEEASDNAAYRYDRHLRLGYARWVKSRDEWASSGKKALLFVMCEDTDAADQITTRFNTDESFKELNGRTINLHTNLKGKVRKVGRGANARVEFVENEKQISDEDLKALRELSRRLDENTSPYHCIVSVLMLREGWDVRNVTTIVPAAICSPVRSSSR